MLLNVGINKHTNVVLKADRRFRGPEVQPKYCLHFLALCERREKEALPFALDTNSALLPVHLRGKE